MDEGIFTLIIWSCVIATHLSHDDDYAAAPDHDDDDEQVLKS